MPIRPPARAFFHDILDAGRENQKQLLDSLNKGLDRKIRLKQQADNFEIDLMTKAFQLGEQSRIDDLRRQILENDLSAQQRNSIFDTQNHILETEYKELRNDAKLAEIQSDTILAPQLEKLAELEFDFTPEGQEKYQELRRRIEETKRMISEPFTDTNRQIRGNAPSTPDSIADFVDRSTQQAISTVQKQFPEFEGPKRPDETIPNNGLGKLTIPGEGPDPVSGDLFPINNTFPENKTSKAFGPVNPASRKLRQVPEAQPPASLKQVSGRVIEPPVPAEPTTTEQNAPSPFGDTETEITPDFISSEKARVQEILNRAGAKGLLDDTDTFKILHRKASKELDRTLGEGNNPFRAEATERIRKLAIAGGGTEGVTEAQRNAVTDFGEAILGPAVTQSLLLDATLDNQENVKKEKLASEEASAQIELEKEKLKSIPNDFKLRETLTNRLISLSSERRQLESADSGEGIDPSLIEANKIEFEDTVRRLSELRETEEEFSNTGTIDDLLLNPPTIRASGSPVLNDIEPGTSKLNEGLENTLNKVSSGEIEKKETPIETTIKNEFGVDVKISNINQKEITEKVSSKLREKFSSEYDNLPDKAKKQVTELADSIGRREIPLSDIIVGGTGNVVSVDNKRLSDKEFYIRRKMQNFSDIVTRFAIEEEAKEKQAKSDLLEKRKEAFGL